jgi:fucose permease
MLALGVAAGLGAGAIDAGLNAYVALHHSPRLLNWLHASYGLGAAAGPVIMTAVLGSGHPWRWGYAIVGLLQVGLGTCFLLTSGRWRGSQAVEPPMAAATGLAGGPGWRRPAVWFSIALFFVYTGIESGAGQWSYSIFTEARGTAPRVASLWVSLYWGSLAVGRLLFGFVANRVDPVRLLRGCMLAVVGGAVLIWLHPTEALGFAGLGLMGLASAPIFPSLIATTPRRLGPSIATSVIGFQVGAASLGIALGPGLGGVLAQWAGLEIIAPFLALAGLGMLALHEALVRQTAPGSLDRRATTRS